MGTSISKYSCKVCLMGFAYQSKFRLYCDLLWFAYVNLFWVSSSHLVACVYQFVFFTCTVDVRCSSHTLLSFLGWFVGAGKRIRVSASRQLVGCLVFDGIHIRALCDCYSLSHLAVTCD